MSEMSQVTDDLGNAGRPLGSRAAYPGPLRNGGG